MGIAQIKKVHIYALRDQAERMVKVLQDLSIIEIAPFVLENDSEKLVLESIDQDVTQQNSEIDRQLAEISRAINFLELIEPVKPNIIEQFAGVKTYLTPSELEALLASEGRLPAILTEIQQVEVNFNQLQARRNQVLSLYDTLKDWSRLDLSYQDLKGTKNLQITLYAADLSESKIVSLLSEVDHPFYLEIVNQTGQQTLFLLVTERTEYAAFQGVLNKNNINTVILPVFETTIAAKLAKLDAELQTISQEENTIRAKIKTLNQEKRLLHAVYDSLLSDKERNEATRRFVVSKRSFGITGWVLQKDIAKLQQELDQQQFQYLMVTSDPEAGEEVPVVLKNNSLVEPFEYLIHSFSYPQSSEVDPTPTIVPFFFIFFGIAVGDAGYGLLLAAICAILLLKLKMGPIGRRLSKMFLFSSFGAILIGILTGSFFSLGFFSKFGIFDPVEQAIPFLIIAFGLGVVQLFFGIIVSSWRSIKEGRWADAFWNQGLWLLFLISVMLVLGKDAVGLSAYSNLFNYLLLFSALGVLISNTRGKKGIVAKLLAIPGGLGTLYGSIGFFSDVLSYARLMALGLSGAVMGGIMTQLAGQAFNSMPVIGWIFGAVIFVVGHLLNFALSVLGAYVHASRLQYLEFFGKFYEGGGKPFTPLRNKPKYTFLINEGEA